MLPSAFDQRLYRQDIAASKAHAAMLAAQGIISASDASGISEGLDIIISEIETGTFPFSTALEDIHMNVETRLKELIGEPAGRLHTARSRNDQVATDFRLWVRDALDGLDTGIQEFQRILIGRARGACSDNYARLHTPPNRTTRDAWPSPAGLC